MAKKSKGGGGGGGGGAAKLQEEIMELKQQLEQTQSEMREKQKAVDRLSRENMSKITQISAMEDLMKSTAEQHEQEIDCIRNEALTAEQKSNETIMVLDHKVRTLERHLEAYEVMERENSSLRERIGTLLVNLEEEGMEHAGITHKMKKEMFNLRMQLEQTFRKTLQELDGQYQKKAFDAMNIESKNALTNNAKLKEELALQSVGVENLLQRYKKQEEQFLKLKIEKSMLSKTSNLQLNQIAALKRQQYEYDARVSDMQYSMRRMNEERLSVEKELGQLPGAVEDVQKYKALYEQEAEGARVWQQQAQELARKNAALQAQHDALGALQTRIGMTSSLEIVEPVTLTHSLGGSVSSAVSASMSTSALPAPAAAPESLDYTPIWSSKHPSMPAKSLIRKSRSANGNKLKPLGPSASAPKLGMTDNRFNFF